MLGQLTAHDGRRPGRFDPPPAATSCVSNQRERTGPPRSVCIEDTTAAYGRVASLSCSAVRQFTDLLFICNPTQPAKTQSPAIRQIRFNKQVRLKCQRPEGTMSRHRNIRNLTEDDYDDYYVSLLVGAIFWHLVYFDMCRFFRHVAM